MEKYLQIGKENLKFHLPLSAIAAAVLLLVSPLLIGTENLTAEETARVLDYFVVLIGIILLPPIFLPEQNKDLRDLIQSKYTSPIVVYFIRLCQAVLFMAVYLLIYMMALRAGNCQGEFVKYFAGCMAGMVFLGGLGIFAYSLSDHVVIAYMVPIIYYIFNYGAGSKYMGFFYLFGMMSGRYIEKICLFAAGLVLMTTGILYRSLRRR